MLEFTPAAGYGRAIIMNPIRITGISLAIILVGASIGRGDVLDDIGVTALRALTNLDGTGIRIAQPEAGDGGANNWEVNPAYSFVSQPVSRFTYISSLGTATTFPNSVGAESGHAEGQVGLRAAISR